MGRLHRPAADEVARHAAEAAAAAGNADEASDSGRQLVGQTTETVERLAGEVSAASEMMDRLGQDSERIGKILDVIRSIAEQTNLLALNAAIEAARAGEQGRGFAVVADEVRGLSARTQEATGQIHGMIENLQNGAREVTEAIGKSAREAQDVVEQAGQARSSLGRITAAVATISDMNNQIATATATATAATEQSSVAEEINRNIAAINQVADKTAAGTQQLESASRQLDELAARLRELIGHFRIA
ncbi:MAG: methyl-accepting chemotaxis protein [Acidihalobacter sp.]|uniref:methyl-accepting chemotaxis protein n=1 Tax=Acidihalobacter sp. TaxID=1872108 RepID=UPI00307D78F7